jgi:arylsulfatase A-like enzyme
VTTEYVPFLNWDTHENGHATYAEMKKQIDQPIAQLIIDLQRRGLLDRTLVILASEFSRDMMIEGTPGSTAKDQSLAKTDVMKLPKHYGLHRHFTGSGSVVLWGGGMKRGYLHGETAPERPLLTIKNPVSINQLHATIYTAMGISPKTAFDIEKRPFFATEDGKGLPVMQLFEKEAV